MVDDDRAPARTIEIYLEEADYTVDVAPDAAAARKHLAQQSYDMAIIDLGLPGEDGLSLTRSLREQGEIGLLILTGRQDATDRIVGLEIGADDYVLKPVELRELLARVRSYCVAATARMAGPGGASPASCCASATGPPTSPAARCCGATANGSS